MLRAAPGGSGGFRSVPASGGAAGGSHVFDPDPSLFTPGAAPRSAAVGPQGLPTDGDALGPPPLAATALALPSEGAELAAGCRNEKRFAPMLNGPGIVLEI